MLLLHVIHRAQRPGTDPTRDGSLVIKDSPINSCKEPAAIIDFKRELKTHSPASGKYLSTAHCMVSLYRSVSSRENTPSGTEGGVEESLMV